jgi:hypothetical protein
MATDDSSGRNPSGNPVITDIEAAHLGVRRAATRSADPRAGQMIADSLGICLRPRLQKLAGSAGEGGLRSGARSHARSAQPCILGRDQACRSCAPRRPRGVMAWIGAMTGRE